jgi:polyisoprenoid-binding protein YceI
MARWIFEPGHTEIAFRARPMMITWVRGLFKDVHGPVDFDWESCLDASFEGEVDASGIWTGEATRDAHLRSADFLDVVLDVEALHEGDLEKTGAIDYYRRSE